MSEVEHSVRIGRESKELLESEAFKSAVDHARTTIMRAWRQAESTDEREKLHSLDMALSMVVRGLQVQVEHGEFEFVNSRR